MKAQRKRLLLLAGLALMTNGFSLMGYAHGSVGGVAKSIEARHEIDRQLANEVALKGELGSPPIRRQFQLPAAFVMDSLLCCRDRLA
ncbi:hypothetical protein [Pseudomonas sp. zfem005]|uniref:hypothetical protein n=1 Tax=Pseudomonas sp. zfem005 TaxID=3078200 RepID=UPI002928F163|nr:hypothetical protein [Pseudomonas sp. zfem005]MDU9415369.1 hypothetical protein [Pseudomonas sp. zfem005]